MILILRKYAPMMLIVMMSLFGVALAIDEYNDCRHAIEDLRVENCVELETEDYEWDEGQVQNLFQSISQGEGVSPFGGKGREVFGVDTAPFVSDKQRLGLVRRCAPRKGMLSYNYILT